MLTVECIKEISADAIKIENVGKSILFQITIWDTINPLT